MKIKKRIGESVRHATGWANPPHTTSTKDTDSNKK